MQEKNVYLLAQGNDSIQTQIIDHMGYQHQFKNYDAMITETQRLQRQLEQLGYIDLNPSKIKKRDSLYTLILDLSKPYKWIKVGYKPHQIPTQILTSLSPAVTNTHFMIETHQTEKILKQLNAHWVAQGKPFNQVKLSEIEKKDDSLMARLTMMDSKTRTIDTLVVKGYEKYPTSFLKYYGHLKKGQKFHKQTILKKANTLNNLRFASTSKAPEVLFTKDSTSVYLYLKKNTSNSFDGFIGFSTDETTQQIVFDGYLNLDLLNNLNFGERLELEYKSDGNAQERFRVALKMPYLLKTPLSLEAGLDIFKKDSTFVNTSQRLGIYYALEPQTEINLGYKKNTSASLLAQLPTGIAIDAFDATFITAGIRYTKYQKNTLFPIRTHIALSAAIGNRSMAGAPKNGQTQSHISAQQIFNLNPRNALFFSNTLALLISDNYLFNELFRFGGITSIRGFEENSLYASLFNTINTEYRYTLAPNLYIHSIIDYAYFEDQTTNKTNHLTGIGLGLGLQTRSGLFKINFANGKTRDQNFEFANSKVHFSVLTLF